MTEPTNEAAKTAPDPKVEPREPASVGQLNERTAKRQRMLLAGIATVILAGASWVIFGTDHSKKVHAEGEPETIETASLVNRNLSQRELATVFGNRIDNVTRDQKALKDSAVSRPEMEAELAALKAENQAMRTDGQAAIDAISAENTQLKNQLQAQASAPAPNAAAMPAYGPRAGGYDARGTASVQPQPGVPAPNSAAPDAPPPPAEVKLMNFSSDKGAGASSGAGAKLTRADVPPLVVEDSPDYLPPNSYAPARVIVGVDASAGVASQTDPLPVVLRITGPARSVLQNGRVLTTRLQGCVINGAARGDLSSEKVYVKLARMPGAAAVTVRTRSRRPRVRRNRCRWPDSPPMARFYGVRRMAPRSRYSPTSTAVTARSFRPNSRQSARGSKNARFRSSGLRHVKMPSAFFAHPIRKSRSTLPIPGSRSPIQFLATRAGSMPTRPLPRLTASMARR